MTHPKVPSTVSSIRVQKVAVIFELWEFITSSFVIHSPKMVRCFAVTSPLFRQLLVHILTRFTSAPASFRCWDVGGLGGSECSFPVFVRSTPITFAAGSYCKRGHINNAFSVAAILNGETAALLHYNEVLGNIETETCCATVGSLKNDLVATVAIMKQELICVTLYSVCVLILLALGWVFVVLPYLTSSLC